MKIQPIPVEEPTPDLRITPRVRAVLAALHRHDGRFGRTRWAEMLAGEPTGLVRGAGLHAQAEYGLLSRFGVRGAFRFLEALTRADLIQTIWPRDQYALLALTPAGRAVLGVPTPRKALAPAFANPGEQAAFDTLVVRRNELAARSGLLGSEVIRLRDLRRVVVERPARPEDLVRVIGTDAAGVFGAVVQEVLGSAPAARGD